MVGAFEKSIFIPMSVINWTNEYSVVGQRVSPAMERFNLAGGTPALLSKSPNARGFWYEIKSNRQFFLLGSSK